MCTNPQLEREPILILVTRHLRQWTPILDSSNKQWIILKINESQVIYYLTLTRNVKLKREYRVFNSQGLSIECSVSVKLPLSGTVATVLI